MTGTHESTADGSVVSQTEQGVCTITLERPARANAYTRVMLDELFQAIQGAEADPSVRVVVITGAGERHFCAGADRTEIEDRDWRSVLNLRSAEVFEALLRSSVVTIAAINGPAVGGGFELSMHCDIRVAADTAEFWLPEPEFGLIPAAGGAGLLPHLVGPLRTKDLILGGARWSAQTALEAGFLSEVVRPDEMEDCVRRWLDRIRRRDQTAIRFAKELIHRSAGLNRETGPERTAQAILVSLHDHGRGTEP